MSIWNLFDDDERRTVLPDLNESIFPDNEAGQPNSYILPGGEASPSYPQISFTDDACVGVPSNTHFSWSDPYLIRGGHPSRTYGEESLPHDSYEGHPPHVETCDEVSRVCESQAVNSHVQPSDSGDEEEDFPVIVSFKTDKEFVTYEELFMWVYNLGCQYGYVINKRRSNKNKANEFVNKIWLKCDRGGTPKSVATVRKTGSKKTGCTFSLIALYNQDSGVWRLRVMKESHNHPPSDFLEGHAYARRLTAEETQKVREFSSQNIPASSILPTLKMSNKHNVSVAKDVNNALQKIRAENNVGDSPMQVLENLFRSREYVYKTRENLVTNAVEEIFFVHNSSHVMCCAFPSVMLIDTTYKTNHYNIPFVQVVGMTSTGKSFLVANAFMCREREENFSWVLQQLKELLVDSNCIEPRVIVTDRDLALINACKKTFPNAYMCLCRFHIQTNIKNHCGARFTLATWEKFAKKFGALCESPTVAIYEYNRTELFSLLYSWNDEGTVDYIDNNWLKPYKESFISCWTYENRNFRQNTTNRVEGMRATLKRYIKSPKKSLDKMVDYLDRMVITQMAEIRKSFQDSLNVVRKHHKIRLFDNLRGKVAHCAIETLIGELNKGRSMQKSGFSCGCLLQKSCGLPCACRLIRYETQSRIIPLEAIDPFWMKLDLAPLTPGGPYDLEENMVHIYDYIEQQPPVVQKNLLAKIKAAVFTGLGNTKPPVVQKHGRGRPTRKMQHEIEVEAARQSFSGPDSQQSRCDPPRHSSYVPTDRSANVMSTRKGQNKSCPRRSRFSTPDRVQQNAGHGFVLLQDPEYLPVIERYKNEIPSLFHPFISDLVDVMPDGNCGFRAVSQGLYSNQWNWPEVRKDLLEELDGNRERWEGIFEQINPGDYQRLRYTIDWPHIEPCGVSHWMQMPYTGLVIAERYHVVLHLLSVQGSVTFFPLFLGPARSLRCPDITMVHVTNHFLSARLQGDHPVPGADGYWRWFRCPAAAEWEVMYGARINRFVELMNQTRDDAQQIVSLSST